MLCCHARIYGMHVTKSGGGNGKMKSTLYYFTGSKYNVLLELQVVDLKQIFCDDVFSFGSKIEWLSDFYTERISYSIDFVRKEGVHKSIFHF